MIRRMYSDLTPEELAVATPRPNRNLVSFGETTKFDQVFTAHGVKSVAVTYETFVEQEGYGFGNRVWFRFKDDPDVLVPQFDIQKRDERVPDDPYTADEIAVMKASMAPKVVPPPDPPPQVCPRPDW